MPSEYDQIKRLFAATPNTILELQEHLALAMLVAAKWDKATNQHENPSHDDVAACDRFTEKEMAEHREAAARLIRSYTATIALPPESWARPILQGMASSFCYTLFLIITALILKFSGIGVLELVVGK
jgi:hypothetical protein